MEQGSLRFSEASIPDSEYLVQEVYLENKFVAGLYNTNGVWEVDFIMENGEWSVSWEVFTQIHQKFAAFVEEMKSYPAISSEDE